MWCNSIGNLPVPGTGIGKCFVDMTRSACRITRNSTSGIGRRPGKSRPCNSRRWCIISGSGAAAYRHRGGTGDSRGRIHGNDHVRRRTRTTFWTQRCDMIGGCLSSRCGIDKQVCNVRSTSDNSCRSSCNISSRI